MHLLYILYIYLFNIHINIWDTYNERDLIKVEYKVAKMGVP